MKQCPLEHLIFDDQGRGWQADSIELRRSLFYPENEPDFILQLVKNFGFIGAERQGECAVVTFCPSTVSPVAVTSLLYWLSDDLPERIRLAILDDRPSHEEYESFEQVLERLHRLLEARQEQEQEQPLFAARTLSPHAVSEGSPFRWLLARWERSNKRLSPRSFSKDVDRWFEGRFCVFRPGKVPSELVIERVGTGLRIPDDQWHAFAAPGRRLADIPDASYGRWVSEAYLSVLRTGPPQLDDVAAKIYWPHSGRVRYESRRLILPCLDADGHPFLLGASIAAARLRSSLEAD
jgi:hypothetical protein